MPIVNIRVHGVLCIAGTLLMEEAHAMMLVAVPDFCPDPSAAAPAPQSFMAGLQAATRNSIMRPSWAINENGEMVDELQLFND